MSPLHVQEIRSGADLRAHFALRYEVYRESGFLPPNVDGLDIDPYDRHSRFLGCWREDGRMVGGVRMVARRDLSPLHRELDMILAGCRDPRLRAMPPRDTPFPSQKAFDLRDVLLRCDLEDLGIVEFSRTVCLPESRGLGVGAAVVNAVHALASEAGVTFGIGSTPPHLRTFYERLGCTMLAAREGWYADLTTPAQAMVVDLRVAALKPASVR